MKLGDILVMHTRYIVQKSGVISEFHFNLILVVIDL